MHLVQRARAAQLVQPVRGAGGLPAAGQQPGALIVTDP